VEDKKHTTHSVQLFGKVAHFFSLANAVATFIFHLSHLSFFKVCKKQSKLEKIEILDLYSTKLVFIIQKTN